MVVVSFGSSPVMGAAGSTYFSVVLSIFAREKERKKLVHQFQEKKRKEKRSERTVLLLDNYSTIHIQPEDDQIGEDVHPPDAVEPHRVFEGDLLRHLHHAQDHDEVGSARISVSDFPPENSSSASLHLRIHDDCGVR